jgi:hypothetical protein
MSQQQGEKFQAAGPEGGEALELGFAQGLQVGLDGGREFTGQEEGTGLGPQG